MQKKWDTEIKSLDSWSMFKVMGELVNGFDHYAKLGPCVAIFGSARTKENNPYYINAEETAYQLVKKGYGVITGGGPGIMEAGNRGAQRGGGISAGCNIVLEFEQAANKYIDTDKLVTFDYFFTRKTMFMRYAQGFIVVGNCGQTTAELRGAHGELRRQFVDIYARSIYLVVDDSHCLRKELLVAIRKFIGVFFLGPYPLSLYQRRC